MLYDKHDRPQVGDIILNKNPYEGESPLFLIEKDSYGDFRCALGPGKYNSYGWEFKNCQQLTANAIVQNFRKIGFISLN